MILVVNTEVIWLFSNILIKLKGKATVELPCDKLEGKLVAKFLFTKLE